MKCKINTDAHFKESECVDLLALQMLATLFFVFSYFQTSQLASCFIIYVVVGTVSSRCC